MRVTQLCTSHAEPFSCSRDSKCTRKYQWLLWYSIRSLVNNSRFNVWSPSKLHWCCSCFVVEIHLKCGHAWWARLTPAFQKNLEKREEKRKRGRRKEKKNPWRACWGEIVDSTHFWRKAPCNGSAGFKSGRRQQRPALRNALTHQILIKACSF